MLPEIDWHGYGWISKNKKLDEGVFVGPVPDRKSLALYERKGKTVTILAYFKNHDKARRGMKWLDKLAMVHSHEMAEDELF